MRFPSREIVEQIRKEYPVGTKVELLRMDDPQAPPTGTLGTVTGVDDMHPLWFGGITVLDSMLFMVRTNAVKLNKK